MNKVVVNRKNQSNKNNSSSFIKKTKIRKKIKKKINKAVTV